MAGKDITIQVISKGIADYFIGNEIIRIESVRNSAGEYIHKRSLTSRALKKIILKKPDTYTIKVWCERWYRLEFEHPIVEVKVEPGKKYQIACVRSGGKVGVEINEI